MPRRIHTDGSDMAKYWIDRLTAGLAVALICAGCEPEGDEDVPTITLDGGDDTGRVVDVGPGDSADPDASVGARDGDVRTREREWLSHDDGTALQPMAYSQTPDEYFEYVRFEVDRPVRIRALRAQFAVPAESSVTVHVWDDFGGNGLRFDETEPLATAERRLTPSDEEKWVEFQFDQPPVLSPGRMFFAGIRVDGDKSVRMQVDLGQPPEGTPSSLVWRSKIPVRGDTQPFLQAVGDFLLRARVEYLLDDIPASDRTFASVPSSNLGIPNFRRIALADVHGDGDPDAMTNGPKLYLNRGDGTFREATDAWIPKGVPGSNGGVFGDYDNDGDPDYFATGDRDRLLRHEGDQFADVTGTAGISDEQEFECGDQTSRRPAPTEAAAWFDMDNDGHLDLYQANYHCGGNLDSPAVDRMWRNRGDGTFESVALPAGTGTQGDPPQAGRGVAPADADGDGFVELFVTNYRLDPNFFFANDSGTLRSAGTSSRLIGERTRAQGRDWYGHSIGAAWGDVDGDGDLDTFVANLAHPRVIEISQKSSLYLNEYAETGELKFDDVTERAGFHYQETPSDPTFWDYDNDSDLDLFYTCVYEGRPSFLYRNDGHPNWTEVSYRTGVEIHDGWGGAVADIDLDGDLDLLVRDRIFLNRNPSDANAVFVRLEGTGTGRTNRDGIGARVRAKLEDDVVVRERYGAHGTGIQNSPWLHVGIGDAETVDLTAKFPATGTEVDVDDLAAGARIAVHEDGAVDR